MPSLSLALSDAMAMSKMNSFALSNDPSRKAEHVLASADKTGVMTEVLDYLRSSTPATGLAPHIKNKLLLLDKDTLTKWVACDLSPSKRQFVSDALVEGEWFRAVGDASVPATPEHFVERERSQSPWTYLRLLLEMECYKPYGKTLVMTGRDRLDKVDALASKNSQHAVPVRKFIYNRWCTEPKRCERARGAGEYDMANDDDTCTIRLFLAASTPEMPPYLKNAMMANLSNVELHKWLGEAPVLCPHISNALFERAVMHQMQYAGVLPKPRTQLELLIQACDAFDEHNPGKLLQAMLEVESYNPYGLFDPTFMSNTACRYVDKVLTPHWALPKVRMAVLFIFRRWQYWPGRWCATSCPLAKFMQVCWAHEDPIWREFFVKTRDEHDDLVRCEIFDDCELNGLQFDQCAMEIGKGDGDGVARTLAFLCQRATYGMDNGILFYSVEEALRNARELSPLLLAVWQKVVETHSSIPALPDHLQDDLRDHVLLHPEPLLRMWKLYNVPVDNKKMWEYLEYELKLIAYTPENEVLAQIAQVRATTVRAACSTALVDVPCKVEVLLEPHKRYEGVRLIMGILEEMAAGSTIYHRRFMMKMLKYAVNAVRVLLRVQSESGNLYLEADAAGDMMRANQLNGDCTQLMYAAESAEQIVLKVAEWNSGGVASAIRNPQHTNKYRSYMEHLPCPVKFKLLDVFCDRYYKKGKVMKLEKLLKTLLRHDFHMALHHGVFTYAMRLETPFYSLEPHLGGTFGIDDDAMDDDEVDLLISASMRNGLTDVSDEVRAQVFQTQASMLDPQYIIQSAHEFVYFARRLTRCRCLRCPSRCFSS